MKKQEMKEYDTVMISVRLSNLQIRYLDEIAELLNKSRNDMIKEAVDSKICGYIKIKQEREEGGKVTKQKVSDSDTSIVEK